MKYPSHPTAQTVVALCKHFKINTVVISPGSRNAPLIIGFTEDTFFKSYSVVDERSAAFFALGIAQQIRKPVALVCTSGSAILNYYPAIAEAFYSDIPLVVLSADRPPELLDIGDGQTIRQEEVLQNHTAFFGSLAEGHDAQTRNITVLQHGLRKAIESNSPVHFNIPFTEPLYNTVSKPFKLSLPDLFPHSSVKVNLPDSFLLKWKASKRKMILVGSSPPSAIPTTLWDLIIKDPSVIVLTESTANTHHPDIIWGIDTLITHLTDAETALLRPEVLVTFGGMLVSKRIKALLRANPPDYHLHVDSKKAYNTFFCLTAHHQTEAKIFLKQLPKVPTHSNYKTQAQSLWKKRLDARASFIEQLPYSDLAVHAAIYSAMPEAVQLQLSNSTAIRYNQLFKMPKLTAVFCNRGTSGIDGSTSTAVGAALVNSGQTLLITGDLSFFYDSNAFWNKMLSPKLKIIVINNNGGGIFRILPQTKAVTHFKEFLETTHNLTALNLCAMYGVAYKQVTSPDTLEPQLDWLFNQQTTALLEVITPSTQNDKILKAYFNTVCGS